MNPPGNRKPSPSLGVALLRNDSRRRNANAYFAFAVGWLLLCLFGKGEMPDLLLFVPPFAVFVAACVASNRAFVTYRLLDRSAAECTGVEEAGPLMLAEAAGGARTRRLARATLIRLLNNVRPVDGILFGARHHAWLENKLRHGAQDPFFLEHAMAVAVVRAVREVGRATAIPLMEALAAGQKNGLIREEAERCLPVLRERAMARLNAEILLRAVRGPERPEYRLLRPAGSAGECHADRLLRPTD